MTYIENREMFFDLNGYLSNLNVILQVIFQLNLTNILIEVQVIDELCNRIFFKLIFQSCNRYLKWVGVERCSKPISGGPTLAGLPGGVAGDLLRLYPVQSNDEYPIVGIRTPNLDDPVLVCRPLPKKVGYIFFYDKYVP